MSKRPPIDLLALTSEQAVPMQEAAQRAVVPKEAGEKKGVKTANLQALAFKVSPEFRRRFRKRAVGADLKLNELLFAALAAWEREQGLS
ncbi:MAG TPA: hypothetical protein VEN28_17080 [Burkholderiaceae bacterium]|nr:hypothetical protein [Burkholderiaceae bacterium]